MEQNPDSDKQSSFARELKVGLAGLGMAAALITIFVTIMLGLSHIVGSHFANSLPFSNQ